MTSQDDTYFMLLSRVCLGLPYKAREAHNNRRKPPQREQQSKKTYDSLLGQMTGYRYREFVVYDGGQTYPEYLIEYKRVYVS